MKRLLTALIATGVLVPLMHCSDNRFGPQPTETKDAAADTAVLPIDAAAPDSGAEPQAPATLSGALAKGINEKGLSNKNLDPAAAISFVGPNVKFTIPAGAIVDKSAAPFTLDTDGDGVNDANPVVGTIDLTVIELNSPADMIRRGRPTVTNAGEWLESGGAFEARAVQGGKVLTILKMKSLEFGYKSQNLRANPEPMKLWLNVNDPASAEQLWKAPVAPPLDRCSNVDICTSDKSCFDQPGCKPFLCAQPQACRFDVCVGTAACPAKPECAVANACRDVAACKGTADCRIKCKGKCDTDECKAVQPTCAPFPIVAPPPVGTGGYLFDGSPFGNIGPYSASNCDRITHLSAQKATTFVRFTANYSVESGVFFIPTGENSAIKLYTRIAGAPAGQEGFQSYANSMPVGIAGKLVVVAVNNGKYYYQEKPYTIADTGNPAAGQDTVLVAPPEVSEAVFNASINAL